VALCHNGFINEYPQQNPVLNILTKEKIMKHINLRGLLAIGSLLMMASPLIAHAAEPEDIIKYRQSVMKAVGGHTGAAGAIVQGKVDYKSDLVEHAHALQVLTRDIPGLFPKDSDFGETRARKDRANFEKHAKDAKDKAEAFAKAAKGGDQKAIVASFKELGESCKACHKEFRKEEKQ
jgi:cytochrome c556